MRLLPEAYLEPIRTFTTEFFSENSWKLLAVILFFKKVSWQMFDWILNEPLIPSTPLDYFYVRIIQTSRFFSKPELSATRGNTWKIKSNYSYHFQLILVFSAPHSTHYLLSLFLYVLSFTYRTILDTVSLFHKIDQQNQRSEKGEWRKKGSFKYDLLTSWTLSQPWLGGKNILQF